MHLLYLRNIFLYKEIKEQTFFSFFLFFPFFFKRKKPTGLSKLYIKYSLLSRKVLSVVISHHGCLKGRGTTVASP